MLGLAAVTSGVRYPGGLTPMTEGNGTAGRHIRLYFPVSPVR